MSGRLLFVITLWLIQALLQSTAVTEADEALNCIFPKFLPMYDLCAP